MIQEKFIEGAKWTDQHPPKDFRDSEKVINLFTQSSQKQYQVM